MNTTIDVVPPSGIRMSRGPEHGDVAAAVYANVGINASTEQVLWMRESIDDYVSISIGQEHLTLDFYDVTSIERLEELLGEGKRVLRRNNAQHEA